VLFDYKMRKSAKERGKEECPKALAGMDEMRAMKGILQRREA
jgi:hypothetical protein